MLNDKGFIGEREGLQAFGRLFSRAYCLFCAQLAYDASSEVVYVVTVIIGSELVNTLSSALLASFVSLGVIAEVTVLALLGSV